MPRCAGMFGAAMLLLLAHRQSAAERPMDLFMSEVGIPSDGHIDLDAASLNSRQAADRSTGPNVSTTLLDLTAAESPVSVHVAEPLHVITLDSPIDLDLFASVGESSERPAPAAAAVELGAGRADGLGGMPLSAHAALAGAPSPSVLDVVNLAGADAEPAVPLESEAATAVLGGVRAAAQMNKRVAEAERLAADQAAAAEAEARTLAAEQAFAAKKAAAAADAEGLRRRVRAEAAVRLATAQAAAAEAEAAAKYAVDAAAVAAARAAEAEQLAAERDAVAQRQAVPVLLGGGASVGGMTTDGSADGIPRWFPNQKLVPTLQVATLPDTAAAVGLPLRVVDPVAEVFELLSDSSEDSSEEEPVVPEEEMETLEDEGGPDEDQAAHLDAATGPVESRSSFGRQLQTSGRGEGRIAELEAIFDTDAVDSINSMDNLDDNLYAFRSSVADAIAAKRALVRSKLSAIRSSRATAISDFSSAQTTSDGALADTFNAIDATSQNQRDLHVVHMLTMDQELQNSLSVVCDSAGSNPVCTPPACDNLSSCTGEEQALRDLVNSLPVDVTESDCLRLGAAYTAGQSTICGHEDARNLGYPARSTDTEYAYPQIDSSISGR